MAKAKSTVARSAQGLRDALFAEIEELRSGEGNPSKAMAVAKLAQQIISITKTEIEFNESVIRHAQSGHALALGDMPLGIAASAATSATVPS